MSNDEIKKKSISKEVMFKKKNNLPCNMRLRLKYIYFQKNDLAKKSKLNKKHRKKQFNKG